MLIRRITIVKMRAFTPLLILATLFCSQGNAVYNSSRPVATTLNGTYAGRYVETWDQDSFLGIPYAQPPVGPFRWKWPQTINTTFSGVRNASAYGYSCMQYGSNFNLSEDCLTLNGEYVVCTFSGTFLTKTVVRPAGYEGKKLPVLVWIYGGGWYAGSTADPQYNLSGIVRNAQDSRTPIIAVSMNYRLGKAPSSVY
jgi:carboxylesterase type B